tara:strand:+ start:159 stop:410 length:252 start_codon:yes stop_codon:yes gene_type:complete
MKSKFKNIMYYWELYYPIILAFISFLYSVTLWFSGNKLEGIFVGIWVPSILAASIAIRQRRLTTARRNQTPAETPSKKKGKKK